MLAYFEPLTPKSVCPSKTLLWCHLHQLSLLLFLVAPAQVSLASWLPLHQHWPYSCCFSYLSSSSLPHAQTAYYEDEPMMLSSRVYHDFKETQAYYWRKQCRTLLMVQAYTWPSGASSTTVLGPLCVWRQLLSLSYKIWIYAYVASFLHDILLVLWPCGLRIGIINKFWNPSKFMNTENALQSWTWRECLS